MLPEKGSRLYLANWPSSGDCQAYREHRRVRQDARDPPSFACVAQGGQLVFYGVHSWEARQQLLGNWFSQAWAEIFTSTPYADGELRRRKRCRKKGLSMNEEA